MSGGSAASGSGGSIFLTSGYSSAESSGMIVLSTSNAGNVGGVSGGIALVTVCKSCQVILVYFFLYI